MILFKEIEIGDVVKAVYRDYLCYVVAKTMSENGPQICIRNPKDGFICGSFSWLNDHYRKMEDEKDWLDSKEFDKLANTTCFKTGYFDKLKQAIRKNYKPKE